MPQVIEEEPAFILPLLDASDALVRDAVWGRVSLSRHEGLHRWLAADDLVRKFVGFTQGVSEGVPDGFALQCRCWPLEQVFSAIRLDRR